MTFLDFPSELVEFTTIHIDSVEQILILQLLHADPKRSWTIPELTKELRSSDTSITRRLEDLYSKGMLEEPTEKNKGKYTYTPKSSEMARKVDLLMKFFRERPSKVIEMIYSRPTGAMLAFAEAFKFRRDDK